MRAPPAYVKTLLSGITVSGAAMVALGVVNYFTRRVLALSLSDQWYGFFYSAFALITLIRLLLDLGLNQAALVLVARHDATADRAGAAATLRLLLAIKCATSLAAAAALAMASEPVLQNFFNVEGAAVPFGLLTASILPLAAAAMLANAFSALRDFAARNMLLFIQGGGVFLFVFFGSSRLGVTAPALGYLVASTSVCLGALAYLATRHGLPLFAPGSPSMHRLGEVWRFSRWAALSVTGISLMNQCDSLMLTRLGGLTEVARYNIALPILQIFLVLLIAGQVLAPLATRLWERGEREAIQRLFTTATRILLLGAGLVAAVTLLGSRTLIRLLFSAEHVQASPVLTVFGAGAVFILLSQLMVGLLNATGDQKRAGCLVLWGVLGNIAANLLFILWLGAAGAALATVSTHAVLAGIAMLMLRDPVGLHFPVGDLAWVGGATALVTALGLSEAAAGLQTAPVFLPAAGAILYLVLVLPLVKRTLQDAWRAPLEHRE